MQEVSFYLDLNNLRKRLPSACTALYRNTQVWSTFLHLNNEASDRRVDVNIDELPRLSALGRRWRLRIQK